MTTFSFLRRRTFLAPAQGQRARIPGRPHSSVRPRLEELEGRDLPSYSAGVAYPTGVAPRAVVVASLNGDARLDLVTANPSGNSVSVLLGNAKGSFGAARTYAAGTNPEAVAVGDFNSDSKADIVTGNGDGSLSVLLGNGDGTFRPARTVAGGGGSFVAAADLNNDGKWDLVTNAGGVTILLGNGDGTFHVGTTSATAGDAVAVGDFVGDGKADVITMGVGTNPFGTTGATLNALPGNGDGTFGAAQAVAWVGSPLLGVTLADFTGDHKLDLAYATGPSSTGAADQWVTGHVVAHGGGAGGGGGTFYGLSTSPGAGLGGSRGGRRQPGRISRPDRRRQECPRP